jgi:endo-1,4-beta-xylanase
MRKNNTLYILLFAFLAPAFHCQAQEVSLKEALKNDFLIGTALNTPQILEKATADDAVIVQQFNSVVAENCMKSEVIHPKRDKYDFRLSDRFVAFGMKHQMAVIGHALIWHSQLSKWFCVDRKGQLVSRDTLIARMKSHIYTVVGRYKGQVRGWDVVNEAFEDDGSYRNSLFYQIIGKDYIPLAFQFAHEADPDAELYYNDYSMFKAGRCDAVVRLIGELKSKGIRIDAVGMQFHYHLESPQIDEVEQSINKLVATGVKVNATEFDLSVLPTANGYVGADVQKRLAYDKKLNPYADGVLPEAISNKWNKQMYGYFAMLLRHRGQIGRVTLWGLSDKQSWKNDWPIPGRKDFPLLFDRNNQPKPVVKEIIQLATQNNH